MLITTVVFDLGGVLIDWNPRYLYRPLFGEDEAAMEHFLAEVCSGEWNREMDAGRAFSEAVAERQQLYPEHAELIALWQSGWETMLKDAIPESVDILRELKARGVRLYALTNWSAETFPVALRRFEFLSWFEDIVVSGQVRLAKPDPRIFDLMRERCQADPACTLYIDDVAANVEVAQSLGFHAVLFENPYRLRSQLTEMKLLP